MLFADVVHSMTADSSAAAAAALQRPAWSAVRWLLVDGVSGDVLQVSQQQALCCAVLCCAVLCCAVLCCAVLCCAVLCCAVLCCAVLCCAVLAMLHAGGEC
jgi:hypothetical protein